MERSVRGGREHLTRRAMLAGAAGSLAVAGAAWSAWSAPPAFRTRTSQFVEVVPARPAPDAPLRPLRGPAVPLRALRGKAVLLNFWATWCPPCRRELPILERLHGLSAAEPFTVVAVSVDRSTAGLAAYLREVGVARLPVFADPDHTLGSPSGAAERAPFVLYGMPITYVIDRAGQIVGYLVGEADWTAPEGLALLRHFGRA